MEGNKFTLKPLPYAYDSLEPYIDEKTLHFHHDKHQQTYVDNLNKALDKHPELFKMSLVEILENLDDIPEDINQTVVNNAGGVFNHEFYWDGMAPNKGGEPTGNIKDAILNTFGSYENFKTEFKNAALTQFGSGWAWLVLDQNNKLKITKTPNQNCPISLNEKPLLTVDVWEHAYYLKYQNKRPDYVDSFFEVINWDAVNDRFKKSTNL